MRAKRSCSAYKLKIKADDRYQHPLLHFIHPVACYAASNQNVANMLWWWNPAAHCDLPTTSSHCTPCVSYIQNEIVMRKFMFF